MRRWHVPLTLLGLGSIGVVLLSERGRSAMRALFRDFGHATGRLLEWNDGLQEELDGIQAMLDGIAESLGTRLEQVDSNPAVVSCQRSAVGRAKALRSR
jgi:hypothetical protein